MLGVSTWEPMLDRAITTAVFVSLCMQLACSDASSHATPVHLEPAVSASNAAGGEAPKQPVLKIALLGDQGVRDDARAVLQLIVDERADALIHLGDFAYLDADPKGWDAQLSDVLGA